LPSFSSPASSPITVLGSTYSRYSYHDPFSLYCIYDFLPRSPSSSGPAPYLLLDGLVVDRGGRAFDGGSLIFLHGSHFCLGGCHSDGFDMMESVFYVGWATKPVKRANIYTKEESR